MRNKLIISTFALLLSFVTWSQPDNSQENIVSAENNFYNRAIEVTNKIEVYPNPAVEYLVIEISNSTLENTEIELRSIIGNEVKVQAEDLGTGRFRIPVKELATGYYFVIVKDEVSRFKKAYRFLKK